MMGQSSILLVFCVITGSLAKPPPTFLEYKDSLGQYSFGYSAPGSARSEVRSIDGSTRGSYSYIDDSGNIQSAEYTADGVNGFQIVATNLPQAPRPVEDTPEVSAARFDHLKALEAASKLAEEKPHENEQRSAVDGEKSMGNIEFDDEAKIQDKMEIQEQTKSVNSPVASSSSAESQSAKSNEGNEMEIQGQTRSVKSPEAMVENSSVESQSTKSNEANEAVAKSAAVENQGETMEILDKTGQDASSESNEPQNKSVEVSSRTDVPVVTTSFVIPGSLNLHTRIQLDQSGEAAVRIAPESSALFVAQSQGANLYPSTLTPAGTKTLETTDNEKTEILGGISSLPVAPLKSIEGINQQHQYWNTIIPSVIGPSNIHAYTYGIGIDPIYRQYNPYQYFPYGIL